MPELNAIKTSYVSKIVYGSITLDEGLAAYKKDSAKYIDAILKDINKK
jgi:putative aldouronate transport system substrate-binding protein